MGYDSIRLATKKVSQFGASPESREIEGPGKIELSMVLESLRRVAEYSADIAEEAINMNIKRS